MKPVTAATTDAIIKGKLEVIVAKKPIERRPGILAPATITGYTVGLQTRRYRTSRFKWLLVETRLITTLAIKTLRPNRDKVAIHFRALRFGEPVQRFEARRDYAIIGAS